MSGLRSGQKMRTHIKLLAITWAHWVPTWHCVTWASSHDAVLSSSAIYWQCQVVSRGVRARPRQDLWGRHNVQFRLHAEDGNFGIQGLTTPQGHTSHRQRAESKSESYRQHPAVYSDMAVNLCPLQTPGRAPDRQVLLPYTTKHLIRQLMFLLCLKCSISIVLPLE